MFPKTLFVVALAFAALGSAAPIGPAQNITVRPIESFANVTDAQAVGPSGQAVKFFSPNYGSYMDFHRGGAVVTNRGPKDQNDVLFELQQEDGKYNIYNKKYGTYLGAHKGGSLVHKQKSQFSVLSDIEWDIQLADDSSGYYNIKSPSYNTYLDAHGHGGIVHKAHPSNPKDILWQLKHLDPPAPPPSCTATEVSGQWKYLNSLVGTSSVTITYGTDKTYSQSNTSAWSRSVTATVSQGWSLLGSDGSVSVSGTIAHDTSNSYSDEWSVSKSTTYTQNFPEKYEGKAVWQFVFTPTDTCGHSETTMLKEYAVTDNHMQPPCCVPGYGKDAPAYQTCLTQGAMVKDGASFGCKVAS